MSVRLPSSVLAEIHAAASSAYPNEGCGALLGTAVNGEREAVRTLPLANVEGDKPRVRFAVSPGDYMRVEAEAERLGLGLLGFWHSHPDHPARPSETDRLYAWVGLLTLVLAVEKAAPRELTAWEILEHDAPFTPVPLDILGETP